MKAKALLLLLLLMASLQPAMTVAQDPLCPSVSNEPWARVVLSTNELLRTTQATLGLVYLGSDGISRLDGLESGWQNVSAAWGESTFPDDLAVLQFAGTRLADAMVFTLYQIEGGDVTEAEKGALASTIVAYQDALLDVGFGVGNCPTFEESADQASDSAISTAAAGAYGTITAQQTELSEVVEEATQQAASAEQAANEAATAQAAADSAQATADAQASAIEPTANAVSTQQAVSNATATALALQAAQDSIHPSKVELSIDVDYNGLINGDPDAIEEASDNLAEVLAPYDGCRVGLSLTFGWSSDLSTGVAVAQAVNQILADDFPEIFGDAALEDFASLLDPPGRVDLELFFYKDCDALGA